MQKHTVIWAAEPKEQLLALLLVEAIVYTRDVTHPGALIHVHIFLPRTLYLPRKAVSWVNISHSIASHVIIQGMYVLWCRLHVVFCQIKSGIFITENFYFICSIRLIISVTFVCLFKYESVRITYTFLHRKNKKQKHI